jgi:galactose-1-phosphate uridylyltransferase
LDYYYSPQEKEKYLLEWNEKVTGPCKPFSFDEYNLYESISNENKYMDVIQANHYLDEGCMCNKCEEKRKNITHKILNGIEVNERINHSETKNEIMTEKINNYFKITPSQKKAIINSKLQNMKNIVNIRR